MKTQKPYTFLQRLFSFGDAFMLTVAGAAVRSCRLDRLW